MNEPVKVSVLTPSFNQARWLGHNLRSVELQTHQHVEHIVFDGQSTDGSVAVLSESRAPGLKWRSEPDKGQSDAINKAFEASTGEVIGWLNSDDAYFSSDAVRHAVHLFRTRPDVGVVYGHGALVNASGLLIQVLWAPTFSRRLLRTMNFISQPTVFVRRSVIERGYFVDPEFEYMMDRELWLHLAERTRFHRLNEIVAIDRHHRAKKSYTRLDLARHDDQLIRERYGLPWTASSRAVRKILKVGVRLAGAAKVREAARGSSISRIPPRSASSLFLQQITTTRAAMPKGE